MADEKKVDPKVVKRLRQWIIVKENDNIKTREHGDTDMVKIIKKRIEEEVNVTTIN